MIWLFNNGSDSTGFYFYSSLIQVKAAIFSIYGIFIVFKLQLLNQEIENCKNYIIKENGLGALTNFLYKNINDKIEFINDLSKRNRPFSNIYKTWVDADYLVTKINKQFSLPMKLLVTGMIIDSFALLLQQFINKILLVQLLLYGVVVSLFIWSLILVYLSIKNIVLKNEKCLNQ